MIGYLMRRAELGGWESEFEGNEELMKSPILFFSTYSATYSGFNSGFDESRSAVFLIFRSSKIFK